MEANKEQKKIYSDDSLDLIELFILLWKKKIIIISIMIIISLLAGLYGFTQQKTSYKTDMKIELKIPTIKQNKYGEFTYPITTSDQYINLIKNETVISNTIKDIKSNLNNVSIDNLSNRISIINNGSDTFTVSISNDSLQDDQKVAKTLYDNYIDYLNVITVEQVVNYFNKTIASQDYIFKAEKSRQEKKLVKYLELLNETEQFLENDDVKSDDSKNIIVIQNNINPEYNKISLDVAAIKEFIIDNENQVNIDSELLNELAVEKTAVNHYYETGEVVNLGTYIDSIIDNNVRITSGPIAQKVNSGISIIEYSLIGLLVSFFFSTFLVVLIEFIHKYLAHYKTKNKLNN